MSFSDPLGPAALVRPLLSEPGERLLWAARGRVYHYAVDGLDRFGAPQKSLFGRGMLALGDFALDALDSDAPDRDRQLPPEVVVFGPAAGCLAHQRIGPLGPGGRPRPWVWALTTYRFAVLGPPPPEAAPTTAPADNRSMLTKAISFGREVAKIATDRRQLYGVNREGEPIVRPENVVWTELRRDEIVEVAVAKRGSTPCLRLSLVDGSGCDLLTVGPDERAHDWIRALSNGS